MCIDSVPKPLSLEELNKKYDALALETQGRLDYTTEKGRENIDLLQKLYQAFSNLYGAITVKDAWNVFNSTVKDNVQADLICKEDFYAFSEVARYEVHNYFVAERDELFKEEKRGGFDTRYILNKITYLGDALYDEYYRIISEQSKHQFYIPNIHELLLWAQPNMIWRSPEAISVKNFIENLKVSRLSNKKDINGEKIAGKSLSDFVYLHAWESVTESEGKEFREKHIIKESEKIFRIIERMVFSPKPYIYSCIDAAFIIDILRSTGVYINLFQVKKFLKIYLEFTNNTRTPSLRGWKPIELGVECEKVPKRFIICELVRPFLNLLMQFLNLVLDIYRFFKPRASKSSV